MIADTTELQAGTPLRYASRPWTKVCLQSAKLEPDRNSFKNIYGVNVPRSVLECSACPAVKAARETAAAALRPSCGHGRSRGPWRPTCIRILPHAICLIRISFMSFSNPGSLVAFWLSWSHANVRNLGGASCHQKLLHSAVLDRLKILSRPIHTVKWIHPWKKSPVFSRSTLHNGTNELPLNKCSCKWYSAGELTRLPR